MINNIAENEITINILNIKFISKSKFDNINIIVKIANNKISKMFLIIIT